eukprot:TRINITY_DN1012_c0_g1_i6.p1 TRINITY_DN1012_c0_g1~~TRINITY_DN1012_c0_g1_i6.p1  ORF type:complete len:284 (-),score=49.65 TRINITY_DN1012_c0_g1_i6:189-1040(-)
MGGIEMGVIEMGPGMAAVAIVFLSLAAKLYMSFGVRVKQSGNGYEPLEALQDNASKAQLNVAEYEGIFTAIFLFLYIKKADGLLVTIVSIGAPLTQALYFWGRVATGDPYPFSAIGALPRFVCMGMMIYILWNEIGDKSFGPGLAAVAVVFSTHSGTLLLGTRGNRQPNAFFAHWLSLAAKLFMSFGIRVANVEGEKKQNASKAQLNVAEYEGLFTAALLFLHVQKDAGTLVTIVSIGLPLTQAIYFWGRVATGSPMPFSPIGALPRYACMGILAYQLLTAVN